MPTQREEEEMAQVRGNRRQVRWGRLVLNHSFPRAVGSVGVDIPI